MAVLPFGKEGYSYVEGKPVVVHLSIMSEEGLFDSGRFFYMLVPEKMRDETEEEEPKDIFDVR